LSASRAGGGPATESARPTAPVAAGKRGSIGAESRAPRQTLPLPLAPAAVLRGITDPRLVLPIYPGAHEVGAAAPADLILDRPEISSRHARIECRPGEAGAWVIELRDHGSTNGTFVNGERVRERRLQSGDRVRFATLEFELQAAAGRSPRSTAVIEP
jgi:pSer/pThr/pTyr-binding forkhead associated (FHA) protein